MEKNIQLQQDKISLEESDVDVKTAKATLFPSLSFNTGHNVTNRPYQENSSTVNGTEIISSNSKTTYSGNYGLNAQWTVWNGNKRINTIKQKKMSREIAGLTVAQTSRLGAQGGKAPLDVAVIRLPRISNFTDFDPLQRHPAVGLRYVDRAEELGRPDLVILPGTKSTLADLRWLRQCGLEAAILKLASRGTPVMGICGGYQMLGRKLSDPLGVEGGGSMDGMGLLNTTTVFSPEKTTTRTACPFPECRGLFASLSGCPLEGYEIHQYKHFDILHYFPNSILFCFHTRSILIYFCP